MLACRFHLEDIANVQVMEWKEGQREGMVVKLQFLDMSSYIQFTKAETVDLSPQCQVNVAACH